MRKEMLRAWVFILTLLGAAPIFAEGQEPPISTEQGPNPVEAERGLIQTTDPLPIAQAPAAQTQWTHFGDYVFGFSLAKPEFQAPLKYYDQLYGNTSWYPMVSFEKRIVDLSLVGLYWGTRFAWYKDKGTTAEKLNLRLLPDELALDSLTANLTLVPIQFFVSSHISPFAAKYLKVSGEFGYEELYFEETRAGRQSDVKPYVNSGWHGSWVYGGALHISLTGIEHASMYSLSRSFGIEQTYLTLFFQGTTSISGDKLYLSQKKNSTVAFNRTVLGASFLFETKP
ncbi:MAG: hypothetical protein KA436_01195 [Oligoflexales bacterium]|nr:hypothetical protein [Oligoflexales bacterium]